MGNPALIGERYNTMAIKTSNKGFDTSSYPHFADIKALVESKDIILKDYRDAYQAETGNKFPMSDNALIAMISCADDDYDASVYAQAMQYMTEGKKPDVAMAEAIKDAEDNDTQHPEDAEEETTGEPEKVRPEEETPEQAKTKADMGAAIQAAATRTAEKLSKNTELNDTLDAIVIADKTMRQGGPKILMELFASTARVLENGHVVDCEIDGWPQVGTTMKDIPPGKTNRIFDKYDYKIGDTRVRGSFHKDTFAGLPIIGKIDDEIELLSAAIDVNRATPTKYVGVDIGTLKNNKTTLENSRKAAFRKYEEAVKIRHKMVACAEKCPHADVSFAFEIEAKTGFPKRTTNGVLVLQKADALILVKDKRGVVPDYRYLNVSEFLRINLELAEKNGGTMKAMLDTLAKEPTPTSKKGKDKPTEAQLYPAIDSFDGLYACLGSLGGYFDSKQSVEQRTQVKAMIAQQLAGEGRKDLIHLLGSCWTGLLTVFTPALQKEYTAAMEAEAKKEEQRIQEKLAANG